jgi:hypothetical protein
MRETELRALLCAILMPTRLAGSDDRQIESALRVADKIMAKTGRHRPRPYETKTADEANQEAP